MSSVDRRSPIHACLADVYGHTFDETLDPFEYYHWPVYGMSPRVRCTLDAVDEMGAG